MTIPELEVAVERWLYNFATLFAFLTQYISSTAQDATWSYKQEDGTIEDKVVPNIASQLSDFSLWRDSVEEKEIISYGNNGIRVLDKYLGSSANPSKGYVLLARKYDGTNKLSKNGCSGTLYRTRGSDHAYLISYLALISVESSYSNSRVCADVVSGHLHLEEVDYNGLTYYACRLDEIPSHAIHFSGYIFDPYDDGFPKLVPDGDISNVVAIKTVVED